jgi:YebC/PmpR family DNA-binding regulatory protein
MLLFKQLSLGNERKKIMSGHSKWSSIKHKKGAADAKRGALFTKLGNAITVAAREGDPDPEMNFTLRLAIDKAKKSSMPKENIERAILRASGIGGAGQLETIVYEGFGPNNIAFIVETLTDNKNRTVSEVKTILSKNGGSLGGLGSVSWMFDQKGVISILKEKITKDSEEFELELIELGADDIQTEEDGFIISFPKENLKIVKDNLEKNNIEIESAGIEFVPKEKINISEETNQRLEKVYDLLEENGDVTDYYTNAN